MVVTEDGLVENLDGDRSRGLRLANACRRPQMIADAVGSAETAGGDDFLVKNALAPKTGKMAMSHMPLARDRADFHIGRHDRPPIIAVVAASFQLATGFSASYKLAATSDDAVA